MDVASEDISSSAVSRRGKYTTMIKNALYSLSQSYVTKEQFARDIGELANELRQASDCNRVFSTFLDNLILCQDEWAGIDHNFFLSIIACFVIFFAEFNFFIRFHWIITGYAFSGCFHLNERTTSRVEGEHSASKHNKMTGNGRFVGPRVPIHRVSTALIMTDAMRDLRAQKKLSIQQSKRHSLKLDVAPRK